MKWKAQRVLVKTSNLHRPSREFVLSEGCSHIEVFYGDGILVVTEVDPTEEGDAASLTRAFCVPVSSVEFFEVDVVEGS